MTARTDLSPLVELADNLTLGLRLLLETARHQQAHPLAASALRAALRSIPRKIPWRGCESFLVVTRDQIDRFLQSGWDYTERRLALLQEVSDFPFKPAGVDQLLELHQQMEHVREKPFDLVSERIYSHPDYPIFQHVGQAFRNQVTGRGPFALAALAELVPTLRRVCDAGCGSGILLGDMLEYFPGASGIGLDISHPMLAHVRRVLAAWGLAGRAGLVKADLRNLPLPPGIFDGVTAMEVLEHLPDPSAGLRALVELLAPGGCLVTSIPVQNRAPVHLYVFVSVEEVVAMHRAAGLQIKRLQVTEVAPGSQNVLLAARREEG